MRTKVCDVQTDPVKFDGIKFRKISVSVAQHVQTLLLCFTLLLRLPAVYVC